MLVHPLSSLPKRVKQNNNDYFKYSPLTQKELQRFSDYIEADFKAKRAPEKSEDSDLEGDGDEEIEIKPPSSKVSRGK